MLFCYYTPTGTPKLLRLIVSNAFQKPCIYSKISLFYKCKGAFKVSKTPHPAVFCHSVFLHGFSVAIRALLLWRSPTQLPAGLPSSSMVSCTLSSAKNSESLKICSFLRSKLTHAYVILTQFFPCPLLPEELLIPAQMGIDSGYSKQVEIGYIRVYFPF